MSARWLQPAEQLPSDHPGWTLEAHYLALALVNFICTVSPERIVMGGGVMSNGRLFPAIRQRVLELLTTTCVRRSCCRASTTISSRHGWVRTQGFSVRWRWRNAPTRFRIIRSSDVAAGLHSGSWSPCRARPASDRYTAPDVLLRTIGR